MQQAWDVRIEKVGATYVRMAVWIQLLLGLALLAIGAHYGADRARLLMFGQSAAGQITAYTTIRLGGVGGEEAFKPKVSFVYAGQQVVFDDWLSREYASGVPEPVTVLFDPAQPRSAMILRSGWINYWPWAPVFGLGLLLLVAGLSGLGASRLQK
jgi:hypothetical protein